MLDASALFGKERNESRSGAEIVTATGTNQPAYQKRVFRHSEARSSSEIALHSRSVSDGEQLGRLALEESLGQELEERRLRELEHRLRQL